ncbi:hypothetical protein GH714_026317 [Hevea brasiliensis]|uniref:Uncharacterized protein n=1 Tax=Hevea brasiliensis TaxID=3981 RepID=A0A6A6NJL7_HEVBR|nr:hypothetical protein GH714_026317 [Hevea brasiliensis]
MFIYVNLNLHHGGKWVFKPMMVYEGGQIEYKDYVDVDFLSYFELQSYGKELHYDYCRIWFRILGLSRDEAFEEIENDSQVNNMLDYNSSADDIDIYFVENDKPMAMEDKFGNVVPIIDEHVSDVEKDNDEHIAVVERDSEVTDVNRDKDSAANERDSQVADVNRDKDSTANERDSEVIDINRDKESITNERDSEDSAANERDSEVVDVNRDRESIANERDSEVADDKGDKESFNVDTDSDSADNDYNINSDADEDGSSEFYTESSYISEMYIDLEGSDDDIFSEANDKGSKVGRDGNENMFPLAIGLVDIEEKSSWLWFIKLLLDDFGRPEDCGWVFMSDKQKGLIEAFKEVGLGVEHRHCMKHLYDNYKVHFRGIEYKKGLWAVASAGSMAQFEYRVAKLKSLIQMLMIGMFEWIRRRIMKRFHVKYTAMLKYKGDICPNAQDTLEKLKFESKNCFCTPAGERRHEVDFYDTNNVVNLYISHAHVECGNYQGEQSINEGHNVIQSTSTTGPPPSKNGQNMFINGYWNVDENLLNMVIIVNVPFSS